VALTTNGAAFHVFEGKGDSQTNSAARPNPYRHRGILGVSG